MKLITISGLMGAGKSTIARGLSAAVPNSIFIGFDENEDKVVFPKTYPRASPNEYDLTKLLAFIEDEKMRSPGPIFFDYPFGRAHHEMSRLIDVAVYLQLPLDVNLARLMRRELHDTTLSACQWLSEVARDWETGTRQFLAEFDRQISQTCDLVVDASGSVHEVALGIIGKLNLA